MLFQNTITTILTKEEFSINVFLQTHHQSYLSEEENLLNIDYQKDPLPPYPKQVLPLFDINVKEYIKFLKKNSGFLIDGMNERSLTFQKVSNRLTVIDVPVPRKTIHQS